MLLYRAILPQWACEASPNARRVMEGEFTEERLADLISQYYNIYYLPNRPSEYVKGTTVDGSMINDFRFVFVDMDLKEGLWQDKAQFIACVTEQAPAPTLIVDSGNGVHVYWEVSDLDAMTYLKFQRRLCRKYATDEAVGQIYQLMRVPNTVNTKDPDNFKLCEEVLSAPDNVYTAEYLDSVLPPISHDDEAYCKTHFDKTYKLVGPMTVSEEIPAKFKQLLRTNAEVKSIWAGETDDRSKSDYRLGHIMSAMDFTRDEAMSVLVNSGKALARGPKHRITYAENIVDKIWEFEETQDKSELTLSSSVKDILARSGSTLKGTRFPCWGYLDATEHGFRLGQVIGLVAGSGVGKTAMALNMFDGFVRFNPDYDHFFVPLEQPANEIADRWRTMCGENTQLHDKVHVISNYAEDGSFRHLSLDEIREYLLKYQTVTGRKVGCVVIDHIGALKKKGKTGENQDLMDICHAMKAFAIETNTLLVMQSQAPREKAGIGDLELNKDAAYGTVYFESYCDFLFTIWQPLKRCYGSNNSGDGCPTVTAFKACKIRHKKQGVDKMQEDRCYRLLFDPQSERMRELVQTEEQSFDFFNKRATSKRGADRKTDLISYSGMDWTSK